MPPERPDGDVCWHVTSPVNRESIDEHGLDWARMGAARGIAGSHGPELQAVFLSDTWDEAMFFAEVIAEKPVDVWEVDVRGLELEDGPDGWLIHRHPIARERLRLARRDLMPPPRGVIWSGGENELRFEGGQPSG